MTGPGCMEALSVLGLLGKLSRLEGRLAELSPGEPCWSAGGARVDPDWFAPWHAVGWDGRRAATRECGSGDPVPLAGSLHLLGACLPVLADLVQALEHREAAKRAPGMPANYSPTSCPVDLNGWEARGGRTEVA